MVKLSDFSRHQLEQRERLIGLGERSGRKSYYPELQRRLEELERFRVLLDNSNDLIFLLEVPSGKILDMNESVCRQTGCSRQDLLERTFFSCINPACAEGLKGFFSLSGRNAPRQKLIECALSANPGNPFPFPIEVTLNRMIFGGGEYVAAIARDITEHKQAEKALQNAVFKAEEGRNHIETVLKSVADGLIFTDMDNRVIMMSAAAETLLGREFRKFYLQPVDRVIENQILGEHISFVKAKGGHDATHEFELLHDDQGQTRILQIKSSLVRGKDKRRNGVITLLRDVSRERELDRMKSEFISTAAHELRTPLTSVRGFSQLLLTEGDLSVKQQREFLSIINEKARELETIIGGLLDLSRVELGRTVRLEKEWHDIGPILGDLVGHYQAKCKTHNFEAVLPEKPKELLVDRRKIVQVMENLLSNAVKFSPERSRVRVACEVSGKEIRVSVKDDGIGMTPEQVERVFEKFYRVDASSTAVGGLGIGMAVVKNIIEAHGGNIWVVSGLGQGTTVSFTLPRGRNGNPACSGNTLDNSSPVN